MTIPPAAPALQHQLKSASRGRPALAARPPCPHPPPTV